MKCDLDQMTTYILRGHLSNRGVPIEDVGAVRLAPCEGGSMESVGSIRCADQSGWEREVRRVDTLDELNALLNDVPELDKLAEDVNAIRRS